MPRDRSLQHQVIATTHEVGEAGMAQHMREQLYLRFAPQLAEHQINRTRGQLSPFQVQSEREQAQGSGGSAWCAL